MDGIWENIILSKSLIKRAQKESKPLCFCLLDIKKAFDSVSHESLQRAIERKGVPPQIRKYITQLYRQATTTIKNNDNQTPISFTTGVLQGDPLSGTLFNLVLDMAFAPLEDGLGLDVGPHKLNRICFADDTILVSDSPAGLQGLIDQATNEFRKVGLYLNGKKCATLRFSVNAAKKISAVNPEPFIKIDEFRADDGSLIPFKALKTADFYKYLGIQLRAFGQDDSEPTVAKLISRLERLSTTLLRPQQRLYALRVHLLPSFVHTLVLGEISQQLLDKMDKIVRKTVRKWLHLPGDTPNAYLHANVRDGGLSITSLATRIPRLRNQRFEKARNSDDPIVRIAANWEFSVRN